MFVPPPNIYRPAFPHPRESALEHALLPGPAPNNKKTQLYKTELCRSWLDRRACRYGVKCQYAHGPDEIRIIDRHPKYRTQPCRSFASNGACQYGYRCCFQHVPTDLDTRPRHHHHLSSGSPSASPNSNQHNLTTSINNSNMAPTSIAWPQNDPNASSGSPPPLPPLSAATSTSTTPSLATTPSLSWPSSSPTLSLEGSQNSSPASTANNILPSPATRAYQLQQQQGGVATPDQQVDQICAVFERDVSFNKAETIDRDALLHPYPLQRSSSPPHHSSAGSGTPPHSTSSPSPVNSANTTVTATGEKFVVDDAFADPHAAVAAADLGIITSTSPNPLVIHPHPAVIHPFHQYPYQYQPACHPSLQ